MTRNLCRTLYCSGLSSCANAGFLNASFEIECTGEQSCSNTRLFGNDRDTWQNIECSADQSCSNSMIWWCRNNYINGNLAGKNSQFYSNCGNGFYDATYQFYGFESGYNSSIICADGETCHIDCRGNSCSNLIIKCASDDTINTNTNATTESPLSLCTLNINCDYAQYDDHNCPNGYKLPSNINDMPSLINVTMSTWDNSYNSCFASNLNCADHYLHYEDKCDSADEKLISTANNPSPLCCTDLSHVNQWSMFQ